MEATDAGDELRVDLATAAFEAAFRANHDDLFRYAVRRVGPDAADDLVADVFLVAWRRRAEVPAGAERLWLFGVAANLVANVRRGQARRERLLTRMAGEPVDDERDLGEAVSAAAQVRAVLATLSDLEQEALRLTEWEQLALGEAAQVAGCSQATFRVRLHRARRRLAARLADIDPELGRPAVTTRATATDQGAIT